MDPRLANIQQLVAESTYPIDESVIAEAILVRAAARRLVPDLAFRRAPADPEVRSFRPDRGARSFRLVRARRGTVGGAAASIHVGILLLP
ncbi:MAG: hypothetical protein WKF48_12185 [Solirubrobacteraceae bacterium]